jgi:hypothetical protein
MIVYFYCLSCSEIKSLIQYYTKNKQNIPEYSKLYNDEILETFYENEILNNDLFNHFDKFVDTSKDEVGKDSLTSNIDFESVLENMDIDETTFGNEFSVDNEFIDYYSSKNLHILKTLDPDDIESFLNNFVDE